ncbi:crossover junction endodeoxyribonuclease RusA [Variovorax sp. YR634]|uniref:RusA family crossover junction endodeoxyribonuclease n=1 Tax=Variovorax sp. YR634 TaxID=1884385 RepID=UPI0008993741|nr:RusA family crossover junction endodeoxyribonuclease [Variovorax sp. YR634]SDX13992.1 crossover junction endodeoxyribonuclease RusA [Variovorax sp. YR634]
MISLTLPYPISANRYWASRVVTVKGRQMPMVYVTSEAKAYIERVGWICKSAGIRQPLAGRLRVTVQLYPHRPQDWQARMRKFGANWDDTVQCMDLTNCEKVLLDALNTIAFNDDKQVRSYVADRMEPDEHGARVVLRIEPLIVVQPQADLLPALVAAPPAPAPFTPIPEGLPF